MRRQPILLRLAVASLVIGGFALVRNLLSTWQTLEDYPNASFLNVFLSTQSATGGTDWMFVFFVWGPLVFGGLGIVLLVAHFVTRGIAAGAAVAVVGGAVAATTHAWQQPQQQAGWQPEQQQAAQTWQQQPAPQQQGWQPEPQQQANPIQPLGGTQQPPPPNAADRIQP